MTALHERTLRLPTRPPLDAAGLLGFLAARAVPGVEEVRDGTLRRTLRLPHGPGLAELTPEPPDAVRATLRLADPRDADEATQIARRLLDLDADPGRIDAHLALDPLLRPLVLARPGVRVPGAADGFELAVRAVLGQQVSVAGARTVAGRLVAAAGAQLAGSPDGAHTRLFPTPAELAALPDEAFPMPAARRRTLRALAAAAGRGELTLHPGADREAAARALGALPGIGPWSVAYVALRALRDPDAFPASDLGVRHALERLGEPGDPRAAERRSAPWRPFRAYALLHLWGSLTA